MNVAFYTGASGLVAYQEDLNTIGNNMSNVGTTGFKPSRSNFSDILYTRMATNAETPFLAGHGVKMDGRDLLFQQGNPLQTGRELDFALAGEGFFAVEKDGVIQYTRNGDFNISVEDGDGYLVTSSDGRYVLDSEGERIALEKEPGTSSFDLEGIGKKIGVWFFSNPYGLSPTARSSFLPTTVSGEAVSDADGEAADRYTLLQRTLEQAAVDLSDQMSNMIVAQRAYQFSAKLVQTADQLEDVVNNLR